MYRFIEEELKQWQNDKFRMPLIIRGARQVGKSFVVNKFGRENYQEFIEINFEQNTIASQFFITLEPNEILAKIEIYAGKRIVPDSTLIFFDEIQACPQALQALRYFKEQRPDIHIIAAGSFLDFFLNTNQVSFPVGRVCFIHMGPMSFQEYLLAKNENLLLEALQTASLHKLPLDIVHVKALNLFQEYTMLGGMPAVISRYIETKSLLEAKKAQSIILEGYLHDLLKYKKRVNYALLNSILQKVPNLIGKHFKYTHIDRELRSRDIKQVLQQLCWIGIIQQVYASHSNGLPLKAEIRENKFKLIMLDVGLLQNALDIDYNLIVTDGILQINSGALAEQVVGQEINTCKFSTKSELFFWEKETRGSSAEIEYVTSINSKIIPIEVKAGNTGRIFSINKFLDEKNLDLGVVVSTKPLAKADRILRIPFYLIAELERICANI